jgi:exosortase/archaeosortase
LSTAQCARTLATHLFWCAASVIWAKKTYRRLDLARWANESLAALATNVCLAIRVAVAGHFVVIRS